MKTIYTVFQYAYLFIAAFFIYAGIRDINEPGGKQYLYFAFALAAVGMFFLKKKMAKKMKK